jgi:4a-hydroxytetrahydrobiopterin dehydratase
MGKLTGSEVSQQLAGVKEWKKKKSGIIRTFTFKDFVGAMKFVNAVGKAAEKANHHPDIDIRWNKVTLTLSTHDAGGLTEKDFAMARKIDSL